MTRIGKQQERRMRSPRKRPGKHLASAAKTGPKKDNLSLGFREHPNAVEGEAATTVYFPRIPSVK